VPAVSKNAYVNYDATSHQDSTLSENFIKG